MKTTEWVLTCAKGALAIALSACVMGCGGAQQALAPVDAQAASQETDGSAQKQGDAASDKAEDAKQAETTQTSDTRQVLGAESADAVEVALTNGLGADLTAVKVRKTGTDASSANMIANGKVIANDEEVLLLVDAKKDSADATYDLMVTKKAADGKSADVVFAQVPLAKLASAKLLEKDGVAYVEYTTADGKQDSTLKAAQAAKKQATQQEQVPAASAAASEVASDAASEDTSYYDSSSDYGDEGYAYDEPAEAPQEAPSAPAQTGDACTGDVEFR